MELEPGDKMKACLGGMNITLVVVVRVPSNYSLSYTLNPNISIKKHEQLITILDVGKQRNNILMVRGLAFLKIYSFEWHPQFQVPPVRLINPIFPQYSFSSRRKT
jgi:hypothetical protein